MSDYIEREALLEQRPFSYVGGDLSSYIEGFLDCAAEAREAIKNAPAADVAPVRHGRWIDSSNGWMCSECEQDNTYDKPYCPNCGAKMDGKEDGHEAD